MIGSALEAKARHRGKMYGCFVDFAKAFDTIDRDILMKKLKENFDLSDGYVNLVHSVIHNNKIKFKNQLCQCGQFHRQPVEITQTNGVMQGDSLSPYLVIMYINDVVDYIESRCSGVQVILYADDMVILTENHLQLQAAIDCLSKWTADNNMKVNINKTKIVKFRNGGRFTNADKRGYKFGGEKIEMVPEYVYLGVTLGSQLTFSSHIKRIKTKAKCAIAALSRHLSQISLDSALKLFEVKIRPIVTYCLHLIAPALKSTHMHQLDIVKNYFLKRVLSLPKFAHNNTVYKLCETKRLCEELKDKNYPFNQREFDKYAEDVKVDNEKVREVNSLAFVDTTWKGTRQQRHFTVGYTEHGFHHRICRNPSFHFRNKDCICKLCNKPADKIDHLEKCPGMGDRDLYQRYSHML